jgi:hypothetical protein
MQTSPRTLALALCSLAACGGPTPRPTPPEAVRAAADLPAPPQPPPEDGVESMNTEYFLGSAQAEAEMFKAFAQQIQALQSRASQDRAQPVSRGFHAKQHACLAGTLELDPRRDLRARHGVFAMPHTAWPVWVRFSNGVGWSQADGELDARGMAMKLIGVPGDKLMPDEKFTQDFLMTNSPTPIGKNAREFMDFAHANADGVLAGVFFGLRHPRSGAPALARTLPIDSMVNETYWSGGAYHLGAHQAVKFSARPCPGVAPREPDDDADDFLRTDLLEAARRGLCFTFGVQFQVDPVSTPIENAAVEWRAETAPFIPIGRVVLPPQEAGAPERDALCTRLSFNPWHGLPAHQPMGHINRARRFVYDASRAHRGGGFEPRDLQGNPVEAASP